MGENSRWLDYRPLMAQICRIQIGSYMARCTRARNNKPRTSPGSPSQSWPLCSRNLEWWLGGIIRKWSNISGERNIIYFTQMYTMQELRISRDQREGLRIWSLFKTCSADFLILSSIEIQAEHAWLIPGRSHPGLNILGSHVKVQLFGHFEGWWNTDHRCLNGWLIYTVTYILYTVTYTYMCIYIKYNII